MPRAVPSLWSVVIDVTVWAAAVALVAWLAVPHTWAWVIVAGATGIAVWTLWRGVSGGSVGHAALRLRTVDVRTGLPSFRIFSGYTVRRGTPGDPFSLQPRAVSATEAPQPAPRLEGTAGALRLLVDDGSAHTVARAAVIGRDPGPGAPGELRISIPDLSRTVSKVHAMLVVTRDGVAVTDLNSANGTWVGGARAPLPPNEPVVVPWDTTLALGDRRIRLERRGQEAS